MTQNDADDPASPRDRIQRRLQRNVNLLRWIGLPLLWGMALLFGLLLLIAFRIKCWLGGDDDLRC